MTGLGARHRLRLALAMLVLPPSQVLAADPPAPVAAPLRAYGQTPTIESIELSPDGSKYAVVTGDAAGRQVQIRDTFSNTLVNLTQAGPVKVRDLQWIGEDYLLLTTSTATSVAGLTSGKREWFVPALFDYKAKRWNGLLNGVNTGDADAMNVVSGEPVATTIDGKPMLVLPGISFPTNQGVVTLFRINPASRQAKVLEAGNTSTQAYVVTPDARVVARADYTGRTGKWTLFVRPGNYGWDKVYEETALVDSPSLRGLGRDGKSVLFETHASGEWQTREVTLATKAVSPPIEGLDDARIVRDPATRAIVATVNADMDALTYNFVDPADQRLWNGVRKAFDGESVSLLSWSADRKVIFVEVEGKKNGSSLFRIDRNRKTADFIGSRYLGVEAEQTAERQVIHYKAADGFDIPAYLTLPKGRSAKSLPLIVLPHGGPAARDMPGFDWWSQALASRGYAVLQPQFRGSDGFGEAHLAAGYGQWGRKMQTDLSDGVRQLAKDGTIDPKRVCIAGASYGGYAALAGVTLDPGVYRCAVAVAGVADLGRMLRWEREQHDGSGNETVRYWRRFMGVTANDDSSVDAWSPVFKVGAVTAPVLLIHGKDDTVVAYEQSRIMADAMRKAGKSVELVTLAGEDHWLSRGPTRIQMLEATVAFLEKHNPPGLAAIAATH